MREAQLAQYNYILVVGAEEKAAGTVNVRTRDNQASGLGRAVVGMGHLHAMQEHMNNIVAGSLQLYQKVLQVFSA